MTLTLALLTIIVGLALTVEQHLDTVRTRKQWAADDPSFWRRLGRRAILVNQYLIMIIGIGFMVAGTVVLFVR